MHRICRRSKNSKAAATKMLPPLLKRTSKMIIMVTFLCQADLPANYPNLGQITTFSTDYPGAFCRTHLWRRTRQPDARELRVNNFQKWDICINHWWSMQSNAICLSQSLHCVQRQSVPKPSKFCDQSNLFVPFLSSCHRSLPLPEAGRSAVIFSACCSWLNGKSRKAPRGSCWNLLKLKKYKEMPWLSMMSLEFLGYLCYSLQLIHLLLTPRPFTFAFVIRWPPEQAILAFGQARYMNDQQMVELDDKYWPCLAFMKRWWLVREEFPWRLFGASVVSAFLLRPIQASPFATVATVILGFDMGLSQKQDTHGHPKNPMGNHHSSTYVPHLNG